jgi:2-polyprenyl-6-methoxyphenol hydroxylase-like FAD-dependent oxidoreductase
VEAKDGEPAPYDLHLGQGVLAEIMARHLEKIECAEIRWNSEVTGIEQDDDEVRLMIETPDGTDVVRGSWLIGADGASSAVRILLGLTFEGKTWPERFVATNAYYDFKSHGYPPATFVRDPVHWAFIIELSKDGLWRITYGEDASLSEDAVRERMDEHYKGILPDADEPYELVSINSYQVHERCANEFRVGRVLLAGDAAHICNPSGGFGLLGGIYDANAVAVSLIAVLEGTRDESILDKYAEERRMIFLEKASPQATLYKQTMMDPEAIAGFDDFITQAAADPAVMRMAMTPPQNLVGTFPIGPGARLE